MALPDVLAAMIHWARSDPVLAAIHGGRVSSRLPAPDERTYPYLRVFDVAGGVPVTEYPVTQPLLQWDAFGARFHDDRTTPDFEAASDLARSLADRLRGFDGHTTEAQFAGFTRRIEWSPGEVVIVQGAQVSFGPVRQADPEGLGRYRVDSVVRAIAGQ